MQRRIQASRRQTAEQKIERARAATDRARVKLAAQAGVENEIDIAHAPLSWWRARWQDKAIRRQFIENFIYIRDAFDENRLVLLKFNDLQADFHEQRTGKDVAIKFRRGGFSTEAIAEDVADAVLLSGRNVRFVPHDPGTEREFRAVVKTMFENLPAHLKPATRYYSEEFIWIDDQLRGTVDSRISTATVQPGHEGKGRGQAITNLLLTEPPYWRGDQRKAATALIEAAQGGKVMVESTPFGIDWTYQVYQQGKKGEAGWKSHFYQWWWKREYRIPDSRFQKVRGQWILLKPGESVRDVWKILPAGASEAARGANRARFEAATVTEKEIEVGRLIFDHLRRLGYVGALARASGGVPARASRVGCASRAPVSEPSLTVGLAPRKRGARKNRWNRDEVAEYIAWRRAKIEELSGGERQFLVEYPENDQDCFEQSGRPVVSQEYLKDPATPSEPKENREYVIGVDSSLGKSTGNPSAIAVIDVATGATVHSEKPRLSPDRLAYRVGELSDIYNGATLAPERNNMGVAVIQKLCDEGYEDRIYRHLSESLKRKIDNGSLTVDEARQQADLGFPTTFEGAGSKSNAAMMLEESIRKQWLQPSALFCDEAKTVVWFDNGKFGAMPGYEDDLFMATLIANYVIRARESMTGGFVGVMPEVGYAR
jgi:hypothetical protein